MPYPAGLLETQGAFRLPSHHDGRLSSVLHALWSHRKPIEDAELGELAMNREQNRAMLWQRVQPIRLWMVNNTIELYVFINVCMKPS